jgi:hypothetical protein
MRFLLLSLVKEWEEKDDPKGERSMPQMAAGTEIEAHLKRWWAQAPR